MTIQLPIQANVIHGLKLDTLFITTMNPNVAINLRATADLFSET